MTKVLEKYFNPENIQLAYNRVRCWPDRMVKDQVGIRAFGSNLETNCHALSKKIISGNYNPQQGFKFYVPKASKTLRTKTVLFIEDAIVYQAIADKIAELNYFKLAEYEAFVFGSVLNQEVTKGTAILDTKEPNFFFFKYWKNLYKHFSDSIIQAIEVDKVKFKFETDITGFFDSVPHYNLFLILSTQFGVEDEILDMLGNCLNLWSGTKEGPTPGVGIPQGPIPSFLMANLLLHQLDQKIIEQGYRYYRYMDDISIYSYEENELLDALLIIDKYTKANALSINSKKTSTEEITEGEEDNRVKVLKRFLGFTAYNDEDFDADKIKSVTEKNKNTSFENTLGKSIAKLSDQDYNAAFSSGGNDLETISAPQEIIAFWKSQIKEAEKELPTLFENSPNQELVLKKETDDIDAIRISTIYGNALKELRFMEEPIEPNRDLLEFWLILYDKFFWRADKLGYTLMNYRYNPDLKTKMTKLYDGVFQKYEWGRYFIIQTLSMTQNFNEQELRQVYFKILKNETSDLAKISLYRLMFSHSKSKQLHATLVNQLNKEQSFYLKLIVTDFNKFQNKEEIDIDSFINSIGL